MTKLTKFILNLLHFFALHYLHYCTFPICYILFVCLKSAVYIQSAESANCAVSFFNPCPYSLCPVPYNPIRVSSLSTSNAVFSSGVPEKFLIFGVKHGEANWLLASKSEGGRGDQADREHAGVALMSAMRSVCATSLPNASLVICCLFLSCYRDPFEPTSRDNRGKGVLASETPFPLFCRDNFSGKSACVCIIQKKSSTFAHSLQWQRIYWESGIWCRRLRLPRVIRLQKSTKDCRKVTAIIQNVLSLQPANLYLRGTLGRKMNFFGLF